MAFKVALVWAGIEDFGGTPLPQAKSSWNTNARATTAWQLKDWGDAEQHAHVVPQALQGAAKRLDAFGGLRQK